MFKLGWWRSCPAVNNAWLGIPQVTLGWLCCCSAQCLTMKRFSGTCWLLLGIAISLFIFIVWIFLCLFQETMSLFLVRNQKILWLISPRYKEPLCRVATLTENGRKSHCLSLPPLFPLVSSIDGLWTLTLPSSKAKLVSNTTHSMLSPLVFS